MATGKLYLVATPIGNLEDITYRAVRTLREAGCVACEDTRHTRKLLDHYGITTRMVSYHEHNERERTTELVERMQAGETVALVSDAGTPLISDPGYRLVRGAIDAGVDVSPIPGASAVISAIAASGAGTDAFYFGGFLPPKSLARRETLQLVRGFGCTAIFYEAPHRILESLLDVAELWNNPAVSLARETTKLHEEFHRGSAREVHENLQARGTPKGEMTLVISPALAGPHPEGNQEDDLEKLLAAGFSRMEAIKALAKRQGLSKREIYKDIEKRKKKSENA